LRAKACAAERFDGILESLAAFPKIGPEIAFFLQTCKNRFYVQRFGRKLGRNSRGSRGAETGA